MNAEFVVIHVGGGHYYVDHLLSILSLCPRLLKSLLSE